MTDTDRVLILQLDKAGKTQTEIAQQLGFTQSSISEWLSKCRDTTEQATQYFKGSALRMARNVVAKGLARDHIQALKGIKVLEESDLGRGISITVNGLAMVGLPTPSPTTELVESERLQITEESS